MKRLAIISFLPIWDMKNGGTAARYVIASEYAASGYEVQYYYIKYPVTFSTQQETENNNKGFEYVVIPIKKTIYNKLLNKLLKCKYLSPFIWKISIISKVYSGKREIKKLFCGKEKPNIIYSIGSDAVLATSNYAKKNNIYHISRFLGTYLGGLSDNNSLKRSYAYLKGIFPEIIAFMKRTDKTIISNDGTMGDIVYKYLKLDLNKLIFYRDGINLNYSEISIKEKNDLKNKYNIDHQIVLLSASRIADWKRVDRILSCVKYLSNNGGAKMIKVIILGDGPLLDTLMDLNLKNETQDIITFTGMVSVDEVYKYLQISNIFISFQNVTNVGNNLLQAIVAGVPIMVTDSGNTREFIGSNKIGFVFENDDTTLSMNFKTAIDSIVNNRAVLDEMHNNMIEFRKRNIWSWEERMRKEIDLIEESMK
jgi:glycosyltransferase involved in cell wall biosynthesis